MLRDVQQGKVIGVLPEHRVHSLNIESARAICISLCSDSGQELTLGTKQRGVPIKGFGGPHKIRRLRLRYLFN
jgi:hypothetical protein